MITVSLTAAAPDTQNPRKTSLYKSEPTACWPLGSEVPAPCGGAVVADISVNQCQLGRRFECTGCGNVPRVCNNAVAALQKGPHKACSDALRSTSFGHDKSTFTFNRPLAANFSHRITRSAGASSDLGVQTSCWPPSQYTHRCLSQSRRIVIDGMGSASSCCIEISPAFFLRPFCYPGEAGCSFWSRKSFISAATSAA